MQTKQAQNLVKDTFENGFDKSRFYYFIKNLLNEIEEGDKDKFVYRGNFIPKAFRSHIKTLERVGKYQDSKKNKIDILIVQLKKEALLERARTMQRNFIAWYLNGSRGGILKDAALVAFVSPNQDDWRFSLVKMEYKVEKGGKIKQELTPAKRYSFLVGENEASHTAQSRLAPLIENDKNNPTLDQLEEVFNIEKVTEEFFEKYRELFLWVKDELEKLLEEDKKIKKDFEQKNVNTIDFAKKLLGQIVFLYFLQKKGWFGVQRDADWGTGPKDFLRRLFEKQIVDYKNFFNGILEPLFYEALARERDDNFYSRFDCKIPFLNGGLFDPLNDYDWVNTDINLPNELFSNSLKTKEDDTGTGILDIFDRFNFTVKEDEPLDKEVAVDPEMLGKVFENLLEVKDRKSKGTYYTPREIVHYMCQQSLINYLATELKDKVRKKDIKTLIQLGETAIEHDSHISDNGKETPTYSYKLPESVRKKAKLIDEKLADIKVCDPAIGSGAFPVGMMNIIVKTRRVLNSYIKEDKERSTYDFKRHAIANCLYGVDIDLGAVEIAKLRLWLLLIVDEQDIKRIKPLPNLDYKIMQGNSLIELLSPDLVRKGNDQEKNKLIDQLNDLKNQYFEATSRKVKKNLRDQINELIVFIVNYDKDKELKQSKNLLANLKAQKSLFSLGSENLTLGEIETKEVKKLKKKVKELEKIKDTFPEDHFEWHLNFNEVFDQKGGFDVVIANPPYVGQRGNKDLFEPMKKNPYFEKKMDYWYFFLHLAYDLNKENGITTFVTTNYWISAQGGKKIRNKIANEYTVLEWINFNENKVFEAGVHANVFILSKKNPSDNLINCTIFENVYEHELMENRSKENNFVAKQSLILSSWTGFVHFLPIKILNITNKLINNSIKLSDEKSKGKQKEGVVAGKRITDGICNINQGLVTGKDRLKDSDNNIDEGVFILTEDEVSNMDLSKKELSKIKNFYKNSDIKQYFVSNKPRYYLLYVNDIERESNLKKYPKLYRHLIKYKDLLARRSINGVLKSAYARGKWWALTTDRPNIDFSGENLVFPQRSNINTFGYSNSEWYAASDVFYISENKSEYSLKYILSIINSKLIYFWLYFMGKRKGETLELTLEPIRYIPIKNIPERKQKPFIEIVDKILAITKSNDYLQNLEKQVQVKEYQKQIDHLVYKLYNLTPEEIKIVEQNTK
ncbi:MAG: Eco57I restriction-modification methylase domain-containing protein [Candidatus Heimdallarchaeaceae archaeon]